MAKSLVTGGAGFIGSHLVRRLIAEGHEVTVLDNLSTGSRANLAEVEPAIRFVEGDIRHQGLLARLMSGIDYVFHQAALPSVPRSIADPAASHDVNVNGTLNLLLAAREAGVRRVICAASSSAYGNTAVLPKVESMPATPRSPYAVTKYVGELYCQVFHQVYGLETVALRYFNVFGPRQSPRSQYAAAVPRFIHALLHREPPVIYGDGEQTRDFTYVENVVDANLRAALAPAEAVAGQVFNIGCGDRISLNRLVAELQEILGVSIPPRYEPSRTGDVRDSQADIAKARQAFGYTPAIGLAEGLRRTVAWFQAK
ncbi:MAG TPA: SDR family oxidoreductase [Chthonomonadaceae bacterium]|nr:SDR family oxidoreductase [Chthonomonadaceae bacterium]